MRILALQARNFRVLKAVDLAFEDRVIGIIGDNGAGKSSIIEAISWALYGNQAARSGKEEIKSTFARPDEDCTVTLDFLINEERYRAVRKLIGKSERAEVHLYRGETSESVGVAETDRYVRNLLGLDWRGFLTSFLARQQELNALSLLQPAKRKDHLAGMLGIERLDKAISRLKEDVRVTAGQATLLERQVAETAAVREAITELAARRDQLAKTAETTEIALKTERSRFDAAQKAYLDAQDVRSAWTEASARLEAARQTVEHLEQTLADLKAEAAALEKAAAEAENLESKLAALPPLRREFEALQEARSRRQWLDQLKAQQKELTADRDETVRALARADKTIDDLDGRLKALPEQIETEARQAHEKLETARDRYGNLKADRASLSVQVEKLTDQLKSIEQLGPESVCDRCLRPLGDDLPGIRGHLTEELRTLNEQLAGLDRDLKATEQEGKELRERAAALDDRVKTRRELLIEFQSSRRERDTLKKRAADQERRLAEITGKLDKAGETRFDENRFNKVQAEITRLEQDQNRLSHLRGSLARRETVDTQTAATTRKIDTARTQVKTLTDERAALDFSEENFARLREAFEKSRQSLDEAKDAATAATKEYELTGRDLAAREEQLRRLEKAAEELENYRTTRFYGEKLTGLFTEFRGHLISRIRPTLADFSSRLMSDMTDGRYTMVELDEKYNLRILDDGSFYGVERFSGGEKDLANLCLRLAISEALTESAGLNRSFVILDEVFGSQDDDRKELIIKGLTNLKHRFPQILLITHVGDIKDRVESLIEVEPTGYGWSTVKVNGSPV